MPGLERKGGGGRGGRREGGRTEMVDELHWVGRGGWEADEMSVEIPSTIPSPP